MTAKPNGTHAKEVAIHFLNATTDGRFTPAIVGRSIGTVKSLLSRGYTKEELIAVIDYCVNVKKVQMYSIGYISHAVNDVLTDIKKEQEAEERRKVEKEIIANMETSRTEVTYEQQSSNRNREKAERNRVQSNIGTKFDFDMLTK